jgi:hypothetical protein
MLASRHVRRPAGLPSGQTPTGTVTLPMSSVARPGLYERRPKQPEGSRDQRARGCFRLRPDRAFELIESRATPNGVTIQVYQPSGKPEYGTSTADLEHVK